MGEPICQPESTREERLFLALLRHGPQSAAGLAEALQTSVGHSHDVLQGLGRKVGLVPLFRYDTLRDGFAK